MSDSKKSDNKPGSGAPKAEPQGLDPKDFASVDDAVEVLIGRRPDEGEVREAAWYQRVREVMRLARDDSGQGQTGLAEVLGVAQSEVSRLETSLGPGTRLGKLRGYLDACAAKMSLQVETAKGEVHAVGEMPASAGAPGARPRDHLVVPLAGGMSPWSAMTVTIENVALRGRDLQYLLPALPALDAALADAGVSPEQAERLRHSFLVRFRQVRDREPAPAVAPPALAQASE